MRKILLFIVVLCGIMLTGCTQLVELTDQESDMLAEYMAGVVLKSDTDYEDALIYPEETEEVPEATIDGAKAILETTDSIETTTSNETSDVIETSIDENTATLEYATAVKPEQNQETAEFLNLTEEVGNGKFSITYSNYSFYDSYPNDKNNNYFTLEASANRKLLMVSFDIKNLSNKTQSLNLIEANINYQLDCNTGTIYKPMMTLLINDIQYINLDVAAGKTRKAVIVFDVLKDVDISNINLNISNQDKTTNIKIK